jgi:hypothetical protein
MSKFTDLRTRVTTSLKAGARRSAAAATTQPGDGQQKPRMACQSLCLQCDARAPCTLGRLIG